MVMESGGLSSTDWTSTVPHPFGPAPGGGMSGLGSTKWTSTVPTPFGPAPGAGMGEVYNSGFAAERVVPPEVIMPDELVLAKKFRIQVTRKQTPGAPSMVVSMRYTDKGTLTKEVLDKYVRDALKKGGFRVSANTLWRRTPVTWKWERHPQADFYFPVVASGALAGTRYSGSAIELPVYNPTDAMLAKLPSTLDIYTIAITTKDYNLDDGEAARALTLVKQAVVNMQRYEGYSTIAAVVRGVEPSVFTGKKVAQPVPPANGLPEPRKAGMGGAGMGILALLALLALSQGEGGGGVL